MAGLETQFIVLHEAKKVILKKDNEITETFNKFFVNENLVQALYLGLFLPDCFDYLNGKKDSRSYRNQFSHFLHNGGSWVLTKGMIERITFDQQFKKNDLLVQYAFLLGFMIHQVVDANFYPYIMYSVGFPQKKGKKHKFFYRRQTVLFSYALDDFFIREYGKQTTSFLNKGKIIKNGFVESQCKQLFHETLDRKFPEMLEHITIVKPHSSKKYYIKIVTDYDVAIRKFKKTYEYKWQRANSKTKFYDYLLKHGLLYNESRVRYPEKILNNSRIINSVQDFWWYPDNVHGKSNLNADQIFDKSVSMVVELIENCFSGCLEDISPQSIADLLEFLPLNMYTAASQKNKYSDYDDQKLHKTPTVVIDSLY